MIPDRASDALWEFAAIPNDIEGGKRVKWKAPWQWAPEEDADFD